MNHEAKSFLKVCIHLPQYVNWGNSCISIVGIRQSQMQACFKTSIKVPLQKGNHRRNDQLNQLPIHANVKTSNVFHLAIAKTDCAIIN